MSFNYSEPATSAQVEQALNANPSITPATQAAITQTLGLGPGVDVPVGDVLPDGTILAPTTGSLPSMLVFDIGATGPSYTPPPIVQLVINETPVLIFNTDRDVVLTIARGVPCDSNVPQDSALMLTAADMALASRDITQKISATDQTFDRVIQLGNGDDNFKFVGDLSVRVTGSGGNDRIEVGCGNDYVSGGDGQDIVVLGKGNDTAVVGWGKDTVTGGAGWDTIIFSLAGTETANPSGTGATIPGQPGIGDWSVSRDGNKLVITSITGSQNAAELQDIEFVQFGDAGLHKQFSVVAVNNQDDANVARLYQSTFDRSADESGIQFWLNQYKNGASLLSITNLFLTSPESNLVVAQTNPELINQIYENAFGRLPDAPGYAYWLTALNNGLSKAQFVDYITTSEEAKTTITNVQVFTDWV